MCNELLEVTFYLVRFGLPAKFAPKLDHHAASLYRCHDAGRGQRLSAEHHEQPLANGSPGQHREALRLLGWEHDGQCWPRGIRHKCAVPVRIGHDGERRGLLRINVEQVCNNNLRHRGDVASPWNGSSVNKAAPGDFLLADEVRSEENT